MNSDVLNLCKKYRSSNDMLYYILHDEVSDTCAVVSSICNYLFPASEERFFGTIIYVSDNALDERLRAEFPHEKRFLGRNFVKLCNQVSGENDVSLTAREIRTVPLKYSFYTKPQQVSVFAEHFGCFRFRDVIDVVEPRSALQHLLKTSEEYRMVCDYVCKTFDVLPHELGVTGSASLGASDSTDYDIGFYASGQRLRKIHQGLLELNERNGFARIHGLTFPFLSRWGDKIMDFYFVDTEKPPLSFSDAVSVRKDVPFRFRIAPGASSFDPISVLPVESDEIRYLILTNSLFRGILRSGNEVSGCGHLIRLKQGTQSCLAMLCTDPPFQLEHFEVFFEQYAKEKL